MSFMSIMIITPYRIAPKLMIVHLNPDAEYWNKIDKMGVINCQLHPYPHRVFGSGLRNAARVLMGIVLDKTHTHCNEYAQGFRFSLHSPGEMHQTTEDFIHVAVEQEIYVWIKPNVIVTSDVSYKYPNYIALSRAETYSNSEMRSDTIK